jgi:hypothetical protein
VATPAVERAIRVARRRLAAQLFLDVLIRSWTLTLVLGVVWLLLQPGQWWGVVTLVAVTTVYAVIRTVRTYPAPLRAALELDSRFRLHERITAAIEQHGTQPGTALSQAVIAEAEKHAARLHVREKFPVRMNRTAWLVPLFAGVLAVLGFVWNPTVELQHFADRKQSDHTKKISDNALSPQTPFRQPKSNTPTGDTSNTQKLATLWAELDRLEREAKAKPTNPEWVADLTAVEDAARSLERESLDRLSRMEAQFKQLDTVANAPDLKDGPAKDVAKALSQGDLKKAEAALAELAKAAAANPNDLELRKQLEMLRDEIRKAGENTAAREKLEKLIEQAKNEGRDTSGLQQDLDRANAEQSQPLKDLAAKLDEAAKQMEKGKGAEAAKQIGDAAKVVGAIQKDAQTAEEAQGEAQRAGELRAQAQPQAPGQGDGNPTKNDPKQDTPPKKGGVTNQERPKGKDGDTSTANARVRVPFVDPKGAMTPVGSGDSGGTFTKTDPGKLGAAIQNAARSAPTTVAGQPLTPADRAAVREFFERLGR